MFTNCHYNILIDNNQFNYCQKSKYLDNVKFESKINLIQKHNTQLFIYTDNVQQSALNLQIFNYNVKVFVLFGLNNDQSVQNSNINVSLTFEVFQGALLCVLCNITVQTCSLVFIASGQQVSGLMIEAAKQIYIQQTFIQYRLSSSNASGIVNRVNESAVNISIIDSRLAGCNLISSGYSGYISSLVLSHVVIHIQQLDICVDNIQSVGNQSVKVTFNGSAVLQCDLCDHQKIIYGLCLDILQHSQELNGMWQCVFPFVFIENQCICASGYIINQNTCTNISKYIQSSNLQVSQLTQNVTVIQNQLMQLDQLYLQNMSQFSDQVKQSQSILEEYIKLNISQLQVDWQADVQTLDNRIFGNATILMNNIITRTNLLENDLLQNVTQLDRSIWNNMSVLNTSVIGIQKDMVQLTENMSTLTQQVNENITKISSFIKLNISDQLLHLNQYIVEVNASINDITNRTIELNKSTEILKNSQDDMKSDIQSLYNSSNQTRANIMTNFVQLQQYIVDNYSEANRNLLANTTKLDKEIFDNVTILKDGISSINEDLTLCNQNISQLEQARISSNLVIQQQQKLIQSLHTIVQCINSLDQLNITGYCYSVRQNDYSMSCSKKVYYNFFDIEAFTQLIDISDFTTGYPFDSTMLLQNAFIEIADNVYNIFFNPLFESQESFTNLKIQFGVQILNSGSFILSSATSITVNQMSILSKPECHLSVTSQLNILSSSSSIVSINNLLVNLSFVPSNGNITLIRKIQGKCNIQGYQIEGTYMSTAIVAMVGLDVDAAVIKANQISFQPSVYNVGNGSSYLFSNVSTGKRTISQIVIINLAVIIGSESNIVHLGSIQSTIFEKYIFGGIIAHAKSTSTVIINNAVLDINLYFSTRYINSTGGLVGYVQSSSSSITLQKICLQQNVTSTTTEFNIFGLLGDNNGEIFILNASITFSVQGGFLQSVGIIGIQASLYAEVINVRIFVNVNTASGAGFGSIFGYEDAKNCSIYNTSIVGGNISSGSNAGGFIGFQNPNVNVTILDCVISQITVYGLSWVGGFIGQNSNATIINSSINQSNISGTESVGGIIGYQFMAAIIQNFTISQTNISGSGAVGGFAGQSVSAIYLSNSKIQFVHLTCANSSFGIVVGFNDGGTQIVSSSSSASNYINSILYKNCLELLSEWSAAGC
ncbi:PGF-pre-PGF_domain-containing protein [Hexamita inflata]|uniref:PGF-pre-PGF domain-containing protein n=1 Tax=Hexamita inflata TaxID=28002 RepID=A0AA86QMG8_9EUKA|nr:PGF-pre-PGF domain-containing protein [Hexamita inflata]